MGRVAGLAELGDRECQDPFEVQRRVDELGHPPRRGVRRALPGQLGLRAASGLGEMREQGADEPQDEHVGRQRDAVDVEAGERWNGERASLLRVAEQTPSVEQQLEEIGAQLSWVRDYL